MTDDDLNKILARPGYKIQSGIQSSLGKGSLGAKARSERENEDLESTFGDESLRAKAVSLNYSGKCKVRLKFYRRRLADYSRAISEKAMVDALVYAGLIRDDSEKEIWLEDEGQEKVESNEEERTEIVLEYSEFDFDNPFVKRERFQNT